MMKSQNASPLLIAFAKEKVENDLLLEEAHEEEEQVEAEHTQIANQILEEDRQSSQRRQQILKIQDKKLKAQYRRSAFRKSQKKDSDRNLQLVSSYPSNPMLVATFDGGVKTPMFAKQEPDNSDSAARRLDIECSPVAVGAKRSHDNTETALAKRAKSEEDKPDENKKPAAKKPQTTTEGPSDDDSSKEKDGSEEQHSEFSSQQSSEEDDSSDVENGDEKDNFDEGAEEEAFLALDDAAKLEFVNQVIPNFRAFCNFVLSWEEMVDRMVCPLERH